MDAAAKILDRVLFADEYHPKALFERAMIHHENHEYEASIPLFRRVIAVDDSVSEAYYLLAHNLTISVGHSHPKVKTEAIEKIWKMPHTSSMYYSEAASNLTEKLLKTFKPRSNGENWKVLYALTGTEAVEIALQIARVTTNKNIQRI